MRPLWVCVDKFPFVNPTHSHTHTHTRASTESCLNECGLQQSEVVVELGHHVSCLTHDSTEQRWMGLQKWQHKVKLQLYKVTALWLPSLLHFFLCNLRNGEETYRLSVMTHHNVHVRFQMFNFWILSSSARVKLSKLHLSVKWISHQSQYRFFQKGVHFCSVIHN